MYVGIQADSTCIGRNRRINVWRKGIDLHFCVFTVLVPVCRRFLFPPPVLLPCFNLSVSHDHETANRVSRVEGFFSGLSPFPAHFRRIAHGCSKHDEARGSTGHGYGRPSWESLVAAASTSFFGHWRTSVQQLSSGPSGRGCADIQGQHQFVKYRYYWH